MTPALFRFGTYNLFNLEIPTTPEQKRRYELIAEVSRSAFHNRTGVLSVQELLGPAKSEARRLRGLQDTAAVLDAPRQRSCGHWIDALGRLDDFGRRRIDTLRVTESVAARAHRTHYGPDVEAAADHLLVTADFALHELEVPAA